MGLQKRGSCPLRRRPRIWFPLHSMLPWVVEAILGDGLVVGVGYQGRPFLSNVPQIPGFLDPVVSSHSAPLTGWGGGYVYFSNWE